MAVVADANYLCDFERSGIRGRGQVDRTTDGGLGH